MKHTEGKIRVEGNELYPKERHFCLFQGYTNDAEANAERIRDLWNAFDGIPTHEAMNIIQVAQSLRDNPGDLKYLEHGKNMVGLIKDYRACLISMAHDGESIERTALCVQACKGMSTEDVEAVIRIGDVGRMINLTADLLKKNEREITALKSDLADAVGLLEKECKNCYLKMGEVMDGHEIIDGPCAICPNKAFLTKHKRKGV